jgi:hypothetical protein
MRLLAIWLIFVSQLTLRGVSQQTTSNRQPAQVVCTFDDGNKIRVQYDNSPATHEEDFRE